MANAKTQSKNIYKKHDLQNIDVSTILTNIFIITIINVQMFANGLSVVSVGLC